MKRISLLLLVMLFLTQASWGQEQEEKKKSTPFWEYRSGISIERFQDLKSSAATLTGVALPRGIYRGWTSDNSTSTLGLDLRLGTVKSPLNSVTEASSAVVNLHYDYLKKIDKPIPFFNK